MERRRIRLSEWQASEVEVSADDAMLLRGGPGEISVDRIREGVYRVVPSHWVGSVALGEVDVVIQPKVGVQRLFHLLSYSPRLRFGRAQVDLEAEDDITEAIVGAFLSQVVAAIRRGPLMAYRYTEESAQTVRGRVRLLDQARRRFDMLLPVEIAYDEFTVDIDENRLLKAALRRLAGMRLRTASLRRSIGASLDALGGVADIRYDSRTLPSIRFTRLNEHYESALVLARAILSASSPDLRHGKVATPTFVIDMDKVFEDFVFRASEPHLHLAGMRWRQGKASALDEGSRVRIKPDLSIWKGKSCHFVGDVKYKRTKFGENDDLYQAIAYAKALGQKSVMLIYAQTARQVEHVVRIDGTQVLLRSLDLGAPPAALEAAVKALAEEIEELAGSGAPQAL